MPFEPPTWESKILCEEEWRVQEERHQSQCDLLLSAQSQRRSDGKRHPVYDFLFDYYSFTPREIRRWTPGAFVVLAGKGAAKFLERKGYVQCDDGVAVDVKEIAIRRKDAIRFIIQLLEGMQSRPAQFGCYGLHEWAMVYRESEVRHSAYPLRMEQEELARFVESQKLSCTHFDAYRFFSDAARPRNRFSPERGTQADFDQRGCIHANMDLYKWCYKLSPLCPSELLREALELAWDAREIDMRASPYDFSTIGFSAIAIETAEGRAEYEYRQREIAKRAEPLRHALLILCRKLEDIICKEASN